MDNSEFVPVIQDGKIADESGHVYDLTRTIPGNIPGIMMVVIILSLVVVVFLLVQGIRRYKGHFVPFIVGILGYAYFGFIMNTLLMALLSAITRQSVTDTTSTPALVVSGFIMSSVTALGMYVCGRLMKKKYASFGDMYVMLDGYALGMIGNSLLTMYMESVIVQSINNKGGLEKVLGDVEAKTMLSYAKNYEYLYNIKESSLYISAIFNLVLVTVVVYGAVVVYAVVDNRLRAAYIWLVIGVCSIAAIINSLMSYGFVDPRIGIVIILIMGFIYIRYLMIIDKAKLGHLLKHLTDDNVLEDTSPFSRKNMEKANKKNRKLGKK
ncbi:MAG TPA: hypothetical protein DEO82_05535 [Eubacterium sp.]|nr:hypothetical protein [Eubacterium sp.]